MNKNKLFFLPLAILLCMPTHAQTLMQRYKSLLVDPNLYACYRTTEKIKVDGQLNEASWKKAEPTVEFSDISGAGFAKPKYRTTAKMLWDDKYLYIAATLEEPDIVAKMKNRDDIVYHDNDFEVFIDPNNDGIEYFEVETNAMGTIFDLFLDRAYRSNGNFLTQWNTPGMQLGIHCNGTLNNSNDKDKYWNVELAIPFDALKINFDDAIKQNRCWRIDFSRVEWLRKKGPEENWVWSPTGKIDMHMPERWGYVHFINAPVGSEKTTVSYPYNKEMYNLLWVIFYEQQSYYKSHNKYIRTIQELPEIGNSNESDNSSSALKDKYKIQLEATTNSFEVTVTDTNNKVSYHLNNEGLFTILK